jgi:hypothetical protein
MTGTEDLWKQYWAEIEAAKFATIAAGLLHEEMANKTMTLKDAKKYKKRHDAFVRASTKHLNRAKKIRRKIRMIENG